MDTPTPAPPAVFPERYRSKKGIIVTRSELWELYDQKMLSISDCGKHYGMSATAMRNAAVALGIPRRDAGSSPTTAALKRPPLSDHQRDLVLGSLLGDACLTLLKGKTGIRNYAVVFARGEQQLEYLQHKRRITGGSKISPRHRPEDLWGEKHWGGQIFQYTFQHKFALHSLARDIHWHPLRAKTVTPDWVDMLTPRAIAYWFMDDGSSSREYGTLHFHTNSFSPDEVSLLQQALIRECRLHTKLTWKKDKGKVYMVLASHRRNQITDFCAQIDPYVVDCLRYKLRILDKYAHYSVPRSLRPTGPE